MTTINRKRRRLVEKLRAMRSNQVAVYPAQKGAANPKSVDFDPEALYISRDTLLELLLGELEPTKELP